MSDGKYAESEVKKCLDSISKDSDLDYQRLYDSHAARGAIPAQVGDFEVFLLGRHGVIEVKETQEKKLLKRSAFSGDGIQLAKMRRRFLSGGLIFVVSFHYTQGIWAVTPWLELSKSFFGQQKSSIDVTQSSQCFDTCEEAVLFVLGEFLK